MALVAAVACALVVVDGRHTLAQHLETVRGEFEHWERALVGWRTESDQLPHFALDIDPRALRAAQLLAPQRTADAQPYWFPVRFGDGVTERRAYAQQEEAGDLSAHPLRIRFSAEDGPKGTREIELFPARETTHALEWIAREAAAELGLRTPRAGFASLQVDRGPAHLIFWSETREANERHEAAAALLATLALEADDATFVQRLPEVVSVEALLRWDALAWALGRAGVSEVAPLGWLADPVTGLIEPIVHRFATRDADAPEHNDAGARLVARILSIPAFRAQRDEILARLVEPTSGLLRIADERVASLVPALAPLRKGFRRVETLHELALLKRGLRGRLARSHAALDLRTRTLAANRWPGSLVSAAAHLPQHDEEETLAASGLSFRREGSRVILGAGRHVLRQDLVLPNESALVLEPGSELLLGAGVSVIGYRALTAVGTPREPIRIAALDPDEPFGAIGIVRAAEKSQLAYVNVSGGSRAKVRGVELAGQLAFNASPVHIEHSEFRGAARGDGLSIRFAEFHVSDSRFLDNASDGLDAASASGSVEQSVFANNGDDGIDLANSRVEVRDSWFRRMGDKAINAGTQSFVSVSGSELVESGIAVAAREASQTDVRDSLIRGNGIGIALRRDDLYAASPRGTIQGSRFHDNDQNFAVAPGATLDLDDAEHSHATQGLEGRIGQLR